MSLIKNIGELSQTDLLVAGGKGANLGALLRAGLPVPGGFVVTTDGYRAFVAANHLEADLHRILDSTHTDEPAALESASSAIRARFASGQMPLPVAEEIRQAYLALSDVPQAVAVRSSATAEDLPDLSFAGQQDTYLNIIGPDALLDAVVRCWASLWTARAIGYRARNGIPHDLVALAVVVQQMVQSESSGVLFTANPLTGKRSETVIDATFGLGEALVSGQVDPDNYVVETTSERILSKTLGAKALAIQGRLEGGTNTIQQDRSQHQALTDEQIVALARLGRQAAAAMGSAQDVEWACANGQVYVVQSRPITSLYPLPESKAGEPLQVYFSFGVWQGMLDPYTPLGRDVFGYLASGMGEMFGARIKPEEQRILLAAGERLFVNITGLLHNSIGRQVAGLFVASIDPASGEIINSLLSDPRLAETRGLGWRSRLRVVSGIWPFAKNIAYNMAFPKRGRRRLQKSIEATYALVEAQCAQAGDLNELLAVISDTLTHGVGELMPTLVAVVASGQGIPYQFLTRLSAAVPRGSELIMDLARGLPHNVTTEMDLALWETARVLRTEPETVDRFATTDTARLVADYRSGKLPPTAQAAVARFLERYGMRGVGEIDMGRRRWEQDPMPVFQVLKSYLQIDPARSPDIVFQRGVETADRAAKQLVAAVALAPGGWFKAKQARVLIERFRELGGLRESPKFAVVRWMGVFRQALVAFGSRFVEQGVLGDAEDVFYLHLPELEALGRGQPRDWRALIAERRGTYERELRRKQVPRVMLSDGTAFYDAPASAVDASPNTLAGSPVSAGTVEGVVHVVFDPHRVQLVPGEILVCRATDPAWTPLFLSAGGLVMQVGGMMTHGSVVAREYGIPAVVGVQQATERLKTGQRVRVDGSSGRVTILSE